MPRTLREGNSSEDMESKVQPKILEAAIKLFGTHGFKGVTTRDLAKEADVVEGSIYQWFKSKENVYEQALNSIIARQLEHLGRFLVNVHGANQPEGVAQQVSQAVEIWYSSLSQPGARLLQQALIADPKRYKAVRYVLDSIVNIIARALEGQKVPTVPKVSLHAAAKTLIHALFQIKVTYRKAAEADADSKEMVKQFLSAMALDSQSKIISE